MHTVTVPPSFAEPFARREGAAGQDWLRRVPTIAHRYLDRWGLVPDGETMHGFAGLVLPVRRTGGERAVLKLAWLDHETRDEPVALAAWNGAGAVRLLDHAATDGVLLLERLDPDQPLQHEPIDEAVRVITALLRRHAIPAPALRRTLPTEALRWTETLRAEWIRLDRPCPVEYLDEALAICRARGPRSAALLVNEDLHFDNVLAGTREPWLVIDPKPLAGDLEFATISLLWNRFDESTMDERFAAVVDGAGLDPGLARDWTLVRAVVNWLWAAEDVLNGLDPEADPASAACRDIAHWAANRRP